MTNESYQKQAMKTNDGKSIDRLTDNVGSAQMVHAALGLTGEAGEVADIIKKTIFHEKEFDQVHLEKELGDVMWYVALMCDALNVSLSDIMQMNADKLAARYSDGFDVYEANHRKEGDI